MDVLSLSQPRQPDSRRVVSGLGGGGVKGVEDIPRHPFRLFAGAKLLLVLRHGFGNVAREFLDRPIAHERLVVFVGDTLALVAVAIGAEPRVNLFAGQRRVGQAGCRCQAKRSTQAKRLAKSVCQRSHHRKTSPIVVLFNPRATVFAQV